MQSILCPVFLAALLLSSAPHAQDKDDAPSTYTPTPAVAYPGGVQNFRDVTFAELPGFRPLTLDLYLPPKSGSPKPAIVFIHGGAWRHRTARDGGNLRDFPAVLASIAARGYVVASWYGLIDLESNPADLGKADVPGIHAHEDAYLGCDVPKCPPGLARSARRIRHS
jgi:hypothetical protein